MPPLMLKITLVTIHCIEQHNNSIAAIKFLFEKGANIHEKNNGGWTPLHVAALTNQSEAMKLLLELGAHPDSRDEDMRTPSDILFLQGSTKMVE